MTNPSEYRARVGLNLLYLWPGRVGGTETYARGLIEGFQSLKLPYEFFVFLNSEGYRTFEELDSAGLQRVLCPVPLNPSLRHLWEQSRLPSYCRKYSLDILHSLGSIAPLRTPCKNVVTIHDLIHKLQPETISAYRRYVRGALIDASARHCDRVITVSHASEEDLVNYLGIPYERIHVTHEGPGQPLNTASSWEQVQSKYGLSQGFFLSVGTAAHKRLDRVVKALELLRRNWNLSSSVVTIGRLEQLPANSEAVRHLGYVSQEDLACLYKHAIALICFSDMEGFGLTSLEAMSLGTPVVASNAAALPEIIGEGGIIVEHGDAEALSAAMWKIATDKQFHHEMRERGLQRVASFSWMGCAAETARAYETVLHGANRI